MDFIGDIVEHDVKAPEPLDFNQSQHLFGFPQPKPKKLSSWKERQQKKKEEEQPQKKDGFEVDQKTGLKRLPKEKQKLNYDNLSEAERIHLENIEILSSMSEEQREREKEELLGSMDPGILERLLSRSERKLIREKAEAEKIEGFGDEWIGGGRNGETWKEPTLDSKAVDNALGIKKQLPSRDRITEEVQSPETNSKSSKIKHVQFDEETYVEIDEDKWEDVEDLDEMAPPSYQINQEADSLPFEEAISHVHFPKPEITNEEDYIIDLNDPNFDEKLHEKYFPELARETDKFKWMEPAPSFDLSNLIFDDVSKLRFDFKGDLIIPSSNETINTSTGLYHHAESPSLAGYTLQELAHLGRSSFPGQRSVAIRTLGRILHKLGKGKYTIVPEFINDEDGAQLEDEEVHEKEIENSDARFQELLWDLVDQLRIIETLEESADENLTRNISVRNYAIEALWLWKQAGGKKHDPAPEQNE